jgi:hypothetical protein
MKKIAVLLFVLVFTAGTAFAAAEWNLYGSARMQSWYEMFDAPTGQLFANGENDYTDLLFDLQGNSRLGATVKFSDAVSGQFEFGISTTNVTNRLILGHWNFGAGTLSVGQGYTPLYFPISSLAYGSDIGFLQTAEPYQGRQPMAQLAIAGFKLALVKQHGQAAAVAGAPAAAITRDMIPKIEVAYGQKFGPVSFNVGGGWQRYEFDTATTDFDIDAWLVGANVIYSTGPFRVGVVGHFSQNGAQFGQSRGAGTLTGDFSSAVIANNIIYDNDTWGAGAVVGFRPTKALNLELGFSRIESESDLPGSITRKTDAYYAQAAITLAPGVFIVPAVGVFERKDDAGAGSRDGEKITFAGAKWQINF